MNTPVSLTALAAEVFADNVAAGWWTDLKTGESIQATRNRGELIALIHSEISEAVDGAEGGLMDDHLPHRRMEEVEYADAVIRILDLAGAEQMDLDGALIDIKAAEYGDFPVWLTRPTRATLLLVHRDLSRALEGFRKGRQHHVVTGRRVTEVEITVALGRIMNLAEHRQMDLWGAVAEKRAYNRHRADHKVETRRAAGGKAF